MTAEIGTILTPLFTITGAVVIGMIMRATGILKGDEAGVITRIVLIVLLPVYVFTQIKNVRSDNLSPEILKIPVVAYLVIALSGALAYFVGRYFFRMERPRLGAFMLTAMFGSTGFIGLPLVSSIYAKSDPTQINPILAHAFYSELGSLTLLVTVGVMIASYFGEKVYGEKPKFSWRILLDIPKNGPFLGMMLGLLFYTFEIPGPVLNTLSFLGQATLPLMMFSMGLTIVWKDIRKFIGPIMTVNFIRLFLVPVLALLLARLLGLGTVAQGVILLNAATPAMIICLVYAAQYNLDREFTSTAVFSSFFFCIVTIPIVSILFLPR